MRICSPLTELLLEIQVSSNSVNYSKKSTKQSHLKHQCHFPLFHPLLVIRNTIQKISMSLAFSWEQLDFKKGVCKFLGFFPLSWLNNNTLKFSNKNFWSGNLFFLLFFALCFYHVINLIQWNQSWEQNNHTESCWHMILSNCWWSLHSSLIQTQVINCRTVG